MNVPCVRVPREQGESVRQALADIDALAKEFKIEATDEWVYIPITAENEIPETYDIVSRTPERRTQQTLPHDLLSYEPSYERLGHIGLIDEEDPERAQAIADALIASDIPLTGVLNRQSNIRGDYRIREWDQLAGETTETRHREFGAEFIVDVTKTYFSPRLATERHRVIQQVTAGERVLDMFAGVGPFIIPMAMRGAEVVGVDMNEAAITYLKKNADVNDVAERVEAIHGDVREVAASYPGWADRIIMNLPHSADDFLPNAGIVASDSCRLHYYDIQHEDAPFEPGEKAIRSALGDEYQVVVDNRHVVRSYAPHEVNICLDVDLNAKE